LTTRPTAAYTGIEDGTRTRYNRLGLIMRSPAARLLLLATFLVLMLQHPPGAAQGQQAQPSFKAAVDLVSLNITVTDGTSSKYVTDLDVQNFSVFEDGVFQELTLFNKTRLPIALSLLIDTSSSMEDRLSVAQEAAIGFAKQIRTQDLAEVIDFDSRVEVVQPYTNDRAALERAVRQTVAGGSTSLYNAVYISLKGFQKIKAKDSEEIRRQALVVLSDGEDTSSLVSFDELLDLARRSETAIFCIGLRSRESTSRGFREATFALRQLANDTGGRAFFIDDVKELAGVYTQIADELSSQYTVGYTSKNNRRDGGWRRIVVRVDRPGATVRTKQGYFGPR
jgi:Ca-activated chloride channel family protein